MRRVKGLISNQEWKERRIRPLYSIGTAKPYKGNQKFEILESTYLVNVSATLFLRHLPISN